MFAGLLNIISQVLWDAYLDVSCNISVSSVNNNFLSNYMYVHNNLDNLADCMQFIIFKKGVTCC